MYTKNVHGQPLLRAAFVGALLGATLSQAASPEPAAQVEAAVRQFLAEQATLKGLVDPAFELSFVSRAPALAPCAQAVAVDAVETRYLSRMRFSATCPGQAGWQRDWIVRAEVSAMVVVAATDVPANRPLAEADLAQERRKLADMADCRQPADAGRSDRPDQRARAALGAGGAAALSGAALAGQAWRQREHRGP